MDVALQQNPQGQSAVWLLGIPLVGLVGVILALTALNKPLATVGSQARVTLALAFYPLICICLLYLSLKSPPQSGQIDLRPLIQLKFGFWGTVLATFAMAGGAVLDIATAKGQFPIPSLQLRGISSFDPSAASINRQPGSSAAQKSRSWLEGQSGEWARQRFEIQGNTWTIGRHHTSDLKLTDKGVSRQHAVIRCGQGRYFIQDQNSVIGTFVNNQRVEACELKPGDLIRIGQAEFRFQTS
jgi:hypothetical protein